MIAWNVEIRTTDSHAIFDENTDERLNPGSDIFVGNHVWVGAKAFLMKKTHIPDGCVVSLGSITNSRFDEAACVLGGSPAKIVRRNIRWERELIG